MFVWEVICAGPRSIDAILDVNNSYRRVRTLVPVQLPGDGKPMARWLHGSVNGDLRIFEVETYWRDGGSRPVRTAGHRVGHQESHCVPLPAIFHTPARSAKKTCVEGNVLIGPRYSQDSIREWKSKAKDGIFQPLLMWSCLSV